MQLKPGMVKHTEITKRPDGTIVKKEIYRMEKQGDENDKDSINVMNEFKQKIKSNNLVKDNQKVKAELSKIPKTTPIYEKTSPNDGSLSDFIQEALKAHNDYRSNHSAPPLVINKELNSIAQQYAEKIAHSGNFAHSGNKFHGDHLGENLDMCGGMKLTGRSMTQAWYNEIKQYDFNKATFSSCTGHFTQLVWVNTQQVGFGVAKAKDGSYYGVANYYPAGNYLGQFAENVKKL